MTCEGIKKAKEKLYELRVYLFVHVLNGTGIVSKYNRVQNHADFT